MLAFLAGNGCRADDAPSSALLDELNGGVLIREERPFHVDVKEPVEFLGRSCREPQAGPSASPTL